MVTLASGHACERMGALSHDCNACAKFLHASSMFLSLGHAVSLLVAFDHASHFFVTLRRSFNCHSSSSFFSHANFSSHLVALDLLLVTVGRYFVSTATLGHVSLHIVTHFLTVGLA
jgi:hypothetical protein